MAVTSKLMGIPVSQISHQYPKLVVTSQFERDDIPISKEKLPISQSALHHYKVIPDTGNSVDAVLVRTFMEKGVFFSADHGPFLMLSYQRME